MTGSTILIFGCGAMGMEVAGRLQARSRKLLLVDSDAECLAVAAGRGITTANIDYTDDEQLQSIGVGSRCDVIFSLFEDDAKNVFLTISARALDPNLRILSFCQSHDSAQKLRAAGATKVIDPYDISGRKIFDLIRKPLIAEAMDNIVYGENQLNVTEVEVSAGCFLDGKRLNELDISYRYNLVLLGVVDRELGGKFIFAITGHDHKLDPGDVLVVIGPPEEVQKFRVGLLPDSNPSSDEAGLGTHPVSPGKD
jgi:voltage-gated potassium channel